MRVLATPDKFRGTADASSVAAAIGEAAWETGWECVELPFSDGGEGLLDVFGGANRTTEVRGPLGRPVVAPWRLARGLAVIEMAAASGLDLVGGAAGNDPLVADTMGTGELLLAAARAGATRIIVGLGGSATTDGGRGAVQAVADPSRLAGVEVVAACDVTTAYHDAPARFGPQKGASPSQVRLLERRLAATAGYYRDAFGVDVSELQHAGAAGGLAGGLAALGAELLSGFEVVAEEVELDEQLSEADLVVTGEGFVDAASYEGKVVGGIVEAARAAAVPVLVVAGAVYDGVATRAETVSLTDRFGEARSFADPLGCVREIVAERLRAVRRTGARRS